MARGEGTFVSGATRCTQRPFSEAQSGVADASSRGASRRTSHIGGEVWPERESATPNTLVCAPASGEGVTLPLRAPVSNTCFNSVLQRPRGMAPEASFQLPRCLHTLLRLCYVHAPCSRAAAPTSIVAFTRLQSRLSTTQTGPARWTTTYRAWSSSVVPRPMSTPSYFSMAAFALSKSSYSARPCERHERPQEHAGHCGAVRGSGSEANSSQHSCINPKRIC